MTNAEKYLKEGASVEDFAQKITTELCYVDDLEYLSEILKKTILSFLNEQAKPQLTEDERVILKNLDKKYKYIGRMEGTTVEQIYVKDEEGFKHCFCLYKHLFLTLKDGEEYPIDELLK